MHRDLEIRGKYADGQRESAVAYFDFDSAALDEEEVAKLKNLGASIATKAEIGIEAFVSEDEGATRMDGPAGLQAARAMSVAGAMHDGGWSGSWTVTNQPNNSADADFRGVRRVQVRLPDVPIARDAAVPDHQAAPREVLDVITVAQQKIAAARESMRRRDYLARHAVSQFFGNTGIDHVSERLRLIGRHVERMAEATPTNADVRPGFKYVVRSVKLASTSGVGDRALITFGREMVTDPRLERIATVIHEGAHAAEGVAAGDVSYTNGRLFRHLSADAALCNADSYAFCVLAITDPRHRPSEPKPDRYDERFSNGQINDIGDAIAHLEAFLVHARQDVRRLHRHTWNHLYKGTVWPGGYYSRQLAVVSREFQPLVHAPIQAEDDHNLAGIFDRLTDLVDAVRKARLRFSGADRMRWHTYRGRLDDTIDVPVEFFGRGHRPRIDDLLKAMLRAAPSVADSVYEPLGRLILGMADVGLYGRRDT